MDADTSKCLSHPFKKVSYECSIFSAYCAQLSVAMAYHKCLDDVVDDSSLTGHLGSHALKGVYSKVRDTLPGHCLIVEESMNAIREIEHANGASPDAASIVFGEMLAFCFECVPDYFPDIWSESLRSLGYWLGRFIYMMDAAVDISDDCKSGSYNPFLQMGLTESDSAFMRDVLSVLAGNAANAFEKLPIVDNVHLLRGILYQGVWQKFNIKFESKQRGRSKNGLNKQDKQDTVQPN